MLSPTWALDGATARLDLPDLQATIDSMQPARGLSSLAVQGASRPEMQLLGLGSPALQSSTASLVDWHIRGQDLVAAYEVGSPHVCRIDLSWQADQRDSRFVCIDMLVSVRTDRLDWRHDVFIEGAVGNAVVEPVPIKQPGCALFRSENWSYAQFVHPADLRCDEVGAIAKTQAAEQRLRWHLFPHETLEKGVILRARVRGLFLPQGISTLDVVEFYNEFIAADPQLGI